jgi:hypothetical protein
VADDRISPTAAYTGYVWLKNGLSEPQLVPRSGRWLFWPLEPVMQLAAPLNGGITLEKMLLQRHRILDALVRQAISAGATQVLEIAAGFSGRGVRFTREKQDIVYLEADLPAQANKKRAALGELQTPNLHVVDVDAFAAEGPLSLEAVTAERFDPDVPVVVVIEGLLNYFDTDSVRALWRRLATWSERFPTVVYVGDLYIDDAASRGMAVGPFQALLGWFAKGRTHLHFGSLMEAVAELQQAGFDDAAITDPSEHADLGVPLSRSLEILRIVRAVKGEPLGDRSADRTLD